jgi:hypothetical protein
VEQPAAAEETAPTAPEHTSDFVPDGMPAEQWGQRFGTVGVILLAILAGVVAYSLSFLIKF